MNAPRFDVINLYQCDPGFETRERVFDYDYFLYVHKGKGVYKIGKTTYTATTGDLFYCPPFVGNTIVADRAEPFLLSGLECRAEAYRGSLNEHVSLLSHRFLTDSIREMVQEYRYGKTGSQAICDALLTNLLEHLRRLSQEPWEGSRGVGEEILDYIAANLHRPLTHRELSQRFSYHKNSINRLLIRETGLSLKQVVIEWRIRRACELLKYSGKSIGEIAEVCGYSSGVFFARQFKEKTGLTPGRYRRESGTGKEERPERDSE